MSMKVFITNIKQIINRREFISNHILLLSPQDKLRFEGIQNETRALQFLVNRLLVTEYFSTNFETLPSGKVISSKGYLSIAHSGDYVLLAVSNNPVGADIEKTNLARDFKSISKRMKFGNCLTHQDFYRAFTAYEADFKLGTSIQDPSHVFFEYNGYTICLSFDKSNHEAIEIFEKMPFEKAQSINLPIFS